MRFIVIYGRRCYNKIGPLGRCQTGCREEQIRTASRENKSINRVDKEVVSMKKRFISRLMAGAAALVLFAGIPALPARADSRVVATIGADLTAEQQTAILQYFGVYGNPAVQIMYINNQNERDLLGSWVPIEQIGTHTISCALVKPTTSGGIQVRTANLNYITSNMIASHLATAGITNCEVVAAAPFEVSGTGALTGILMAYERSTSTALDQNKSNVAVQELVTTTDLANKVGQQEAQQIVNDIKLQIIEGNLEATDVEQVNQIVNDVITNYTDDSLIVYTDNSSTNTTVNNTTNNTVNNTTNNTVNNNTVNNNTVNNTTNNTTTNVSNNTTNYTSGLSQEDIVQLQIFAANLAAQSYDEGTKAALAQIQQSLEQQTQKTSSAQTQDIVASVESEAEARQPVMEPEKEALNNILNQVNLDALANIPGMQGVVESSTDQSVLSESSNNLDVQIQEQYTAPAQEPVPDSAPAPNVDPEWQALNDQLNQENLEIASHIPGMEGISTEPQPEAAPTEQTDLATAKTAETPEETPAETPAEISLDSLEEAPSTAAAGSVFFTDEQRGTEFKFKVLGTEKTTDGAASGVSAVVVELPYNDLAPVSGTLTVTDEYGSQLAYLDLAAASASQYSTVSENGSITVPDGWNGYTAVQMVPVSTSTGSAFSADPYNTYTYTLTDAVFAGSDGATSVTVNSSRSGGFVSDAGYTIPSLDLNNIMKGSSVSGTVIFPSGAAYATVATDNDKMYADCSYATPDLAGVSLNFDGRGKSTLTIDFYTDEASQQAGESALYEVEYVLYIQ